MTFDELVNKFNEERGLNSPWPHTYEVDAETYANVCQYIFSIGSNNSRWPNIVAISLGPNDGILVKGVELILTKEKK